ncbi:hypothetical protein F5887DRAFT_990881 [Amanita rubescens]|nr:hypothetical protein F5887DRAFT_990881 [Amanita rubescens]
MSQLQLANANLAIERFRILVIGNANAGKTTILKKVCHAQGREPICFNRDGEPIAAELKPDASRGEHDIEDSFQYPTAHGFIFHDSRGFEAGATGELDNVTDFIKKRAEREELKDRLHAIWYCIPTSNDRPMTEAGKKLFEIDTGNVPVIAIFTKMDGLEDRAFNRLAMDGIFDEEKATAEAKATFERNYLEPLEAVKHKPCHTIKLRDMDKEGTICDELILRTSQALDGDALKLFCLSILRNDMESRIKDVINKIIIPKAKEARESVSFSNEQAKSLFCDVMCRFPHMLAVYVICSS